MNSGLRKGKSVLAMRCSNLSTGLELLNSQRAWTVVLGSQVLEGLDHLGIVTEAKQILGRLAQSDDRDSEKRHDKDNGATGEEHISPAPVVRLGAGLNVHAVPLLGHHESPSNETGDGLSKTPPSSQESEKPLLVARKIFKEDGCIQNEIAASTKAEESDEERERRPAGHGTSKNAASGADEESDVKSPLAANDIGAEAPEKGACQHTDVYGNGEGIGVAMLAKFAVGLGGNNGLEEEDHGIHSITTRRARLAHKNISHVSGCSMRA